MNNLTINEFKFLHQVIGYVHQFKYIGPCDGICGVINQFNPNIELLNSYYINIVIKPDIYVNVRNIIIDNDHIQYFTQQRTSHNYTIGGDITKVYIEINGYMLTYSMLTLIMHTKLTLSDIGTIISLIGSNKYDIYSAELSDGYTTIHYNNKILVIGNIRTSLPALVRLIEYDLIPAKINV